MLVEFVQRNLVLRKAREMDKKENTIALYEHWISKYEETYGIKYMTGIRTYELALFKTLKNKYNYHLVSKAIDKYFATTKKDKAFVMEFARKFDNLFKDLIEEMNKEKYG